MAKLSINKNKMFLPLSVSKGTTEERLQKARLLNLKFFDNIKDEFVDREIKPSTFKRILKKTAGSKIGVEIFESLDNKKTYTSLITNENGKLNGYAFYFPLTYLNNNIRQSNAMNFLKETQKFFNSIFNPKFLTREIKVFNKNKNSTKLGRFYLDNIAEKQVLKPEKLDKFLGSKKNEDKINILQFFRYKLFAEKNIHQAEPQITKHIEKADNLKILTKSDNLEVYQYDEKLSLLNNKLLNIIKQERDNLK